MKVFLACTSLRPEYGGPAHSVARLAAALAQEGARVGVWAADGSRPQATHSSSISGLSGTPDEALAAFHPFDILHDNGIWLPHNHHLAVAARRMRIPHVVSTRGMLQPWAMSHKRLKKMLAWHLYQRRDLRGAQGHHATSASEGEAVSAMRLGVPVHVIPNGVDVPPFEADEAGRSARVPGAPRRALFLGRLYPVKGLPMLLDAWSEVRPSGWTLTIAGPDEAGHRGLLEAKIAALGLRDSISFAGPLDGLAKHAALSDADLFVLPSHSESFGMAIAEALAHGIPVLATRAAPWKGLEERGCGWWVDANERAIANGLRIATGLEGEKLRAMGGIGRRWMHAEYRWDAVARTFAEVYESLLRSPSRS